VLILLNILYAWDEEKITSSKSMTLKELFMLKTCSYDDGKAKNN
jgi:hypothetical protein